MLLFTKVVPILHYSVSPTEGVEHLVVKKELFAMNDLAPTDWRGNKVGLY